MGNADGKEGALFGGLLADFRQPCQVAPNQEVVLQPIGHGFGVFGINKFEGALFGFFQKWDEFFKAAV